MLSLRSRLALALCLAAVGCGTEAPPEAYGSPFEEAAANPGRWVYVPTPGAVCRDGAPVGFGLRLQNGAEDLVIVLDGGGACSDRASCRGNRDTYSSADFATQIGRRGEEGIASPTAENPVGRWNAVFVPYCTGDLHAGTRPDAAVPGVDGVQQFVGHRNLQAFLDTISANLPQPRRVLLAGGSAGGFGALFNFEAVARQFPASGVALLDDSGPVFYDDAVFPPDLGARFEALYGVSAAVPGSRIGEPDALETIYAYYAETYPRAALGLSSYVNDRTIRDYFGDGVDSVVPPEAYAQAIDDLQARLPEVWQTYVAPDTGHVFISGSTSYFSAPTGEPYADWVGRLVERARPAAEDGPLAPEAE